MMEDEGYIKFRCIWTPGELPVTPLFDHLNSWRDRMYAHKLIGENSDGIGYGNISVRLHENTFLITGTGTGKITSLSAQHYTIVTHYDFKQNSLTCKGPVKASSESLTHAAVYDVLSHINAVIHIHNIELWLNLINKKPTTSDQIEYGSSEMAFEISELITSENFNSELIIMGGHREGIIALGASLDDAGQVILDLL